MDELEKKRKYDREYKRAQRANNTPYAQRTRERKRSEKAKSRRRELRKRTSIRRKERAYVKEYRKRPHVIAKARARATAAYAIASGRIKRPDRCELCGRKESHLADGRSSLRADHYKGYEHPLVVRFVCLSCDGKQEMERGNTTLGKRLAFD